jgi:hypothetical protein
MSWCNRNTVDTKRVRLRLQRTGGLAQVGVVAQVKVQSVSVGSGGAHQLLKLGVKVRHVIPIEEMRAAGRVKSVLLQMRVCLGCYALKWVPHALIDC